MRRPSMKDLATALREALIRYAATMPTEARQALTRAVAALDAAQMESPEFVQRYMAKALINGIGGMVEDCWSASHGTLASESKKE
jgi:hypothetical protein